MLNQVKKITVQYPGFVSFCIKSAFLIGFFIALQFASKPFLDPIKIPVELNTIEFTVLGGVMMYGFVIFLILIKNDISKFKIFKFSLRDFIIFTFMGFCAHAAFIWLKYYISLNSSFALQNLWFFYVFKHFLLFSTLIFFAIGLFGISFCLFLFNTYRKELVITVTLFGVFLFFAYIVLNSWQFLSGSITQILSFLLKLTFSDVEAYGLSGLRVGSFRVDVGKVCSGVESILMFSVLFSLIFFVDRNKLDWKKMLIVFIPGLIGDYFVNVIRIYLLLLVGILVSPELAIGVFHTNAGWVLFIVYFFVFWYLAFPFVSLKKN